MRDLGADDVIDYSTGDVVEQIRTLIPDGVDVVLHAAPTPFESIIGAIRDEGVLASITDPAPGTVERETRTVVTNGSRGTDLLDALSTLFDTGVLTTVAIERSYPLNEARQAQERIATGHVRGKIVIAIQ